MAHKVAAAKKAFETVRPVIGLEIHAQLKTNAKVFSRGGNQYTASPNTQLDLLDAAIPGSLPLVNQAALKAAVISSISLNCQVQREIYFDRKNYFYPDMPAGFQITQKDRPLAIDGYLDFIVSSDHKIKTYTGSYGVYRHLFKERYDPNSAITKRSKIKQVQLEQDSAKTFHETGSDGGQFSLIDYNRSGSGLIEIVFEPDLTSHDEATSLIRELIIHLRAIDTCGCELSEGSIRVDANVSIAELDGINVNPDARKVELKNLNSLTAIKRAIKYEVDRQASMYSQNMEVKNETRIYDSKLAKTIPIRLKEDETDYRFVPEPSIPPMILDEVFVENLRRQVPKNIPSNERRRLQEKYQLNAETLMGLIERPELVDLFEQAVPTTSNFDHEIAADFLLYCFNKLKKVPSLGIQSGKMDPLKIQQLLQHIFDDTISFEIGYELLKFYQTNGTEKDIVELIDEFGWRQIVDQKDIEIICRDIVKGMFIVSKKYKKSGDIPYMRMMLEQICHLHNNRVCLKRAKQCLDTMLRTKV